MQFYSLIDHKELDYLQTIDCRELRVLAIYHYCSKHSLPFPWGMVEEAFSIIRDFVMDRTSTKLGRAAGPIERLRQDVIHVARHDCVIEVREKQRLFAEEFAYLKDLRKRANVPTSVFQEKEKMHDWLGDTLEQAFECTSMLLKRTIAVGRSDTVKFSYFQCRKMCSPVMRAGLFDDEFLRWLGIDNDTVRNFGGKKGTPFYNLTL